MIQYRFSSMDSRRPLLMTNSRRLIKYMTTFFLIATWIRTGCATGANELPDFTTMPTPPSFKHEPNPPIMYFVVQHVNGRNHHENGNSNSLKERRLICEADGYPEPKCYWKKNGVILDIEESNGRITQQQGFGTIAITSLQKTDEGTYQCFCENDNGTAYDRPIELKQTYIEYFGHSKVDVVEVPLGQPFERKCTPPRSVPPARVFWIYMGAGQGRGQLTAFNSINSSHIAMNDKGQIFLQYVKDEDNPPDLYFTCTAENMELKDYKFGDQFRIKTFKKPGEMFPKYIPPAEQFVSPDHVTALKGETLELFCIFSGYPDQKPIWRKVDGSIDWNRVTFGTNFNKSLKVDNVDFRDEGLYECSFETDVTGTRRRQFTVSIDAAPYWVESPPHSMNSSETETVEFKCQATGRPQPTFTFYKNGEELVADNSHVFIEGSTLRIVDLRKASNKQGDNAVYQCKAENKYGYIWANFYLNLLSFPPVLLEGPGEIVAVVGQTKKLSCKFFGSPRPSVQWISFPLLGARGHGPVDHQGYSSLHLYDIGKENEGAYECSAENKYGNASGKGYLTVRDATRLVSFPIDNITVAGKPLRLPCLATTDPALKAKITWLLHGHPIDVTNPRFIVERDNTLRIDSAVGTDTGEYTCVAETEYDRVNKSAKIVVRDVPTPPLNVWIQCENTSLSATVTFQYIEMSQDVPAKEFWVQFNMDENEPNYWETYPTPVSHLNGDFGTLRPSLHAYGNFAFRVIARNDVGDSAPTMGDRRCTTPASLPSRNPSKVLVKGNTPEDVTVYWEPMERRDWNGPNFEYVVQYRPSPPAEQESYDQEAAPFHEVIVSDPEQSHLVLPSTGPYQSYEVRVRARNNEGYSSAMPATIKGYSGEEKPNVAPSGFDVILSDKPTTATFVWEPYDSSGFKGVLKGFKIEHWHKTNKRAEPNIKVAYFDPSATRGTVFDLKPYTENYARILAYGGGGDGPPSEIRTFTMPEGFSTPVQHLRAFALSHNELGVVWKQPREMNGIFRGYNITWCKVDPVGGPYRIDFESCGSSAYINGTHYRIQEKLQPSTEYRVEVSCVTGAGLGEPNSLDVWTMPDDVQQVAPEKPDAMEAGIGEDHLNVTWIPGKFNADDPRPVGTDHYVEYKIKGEDTWTRVLHQDRNFTVQIIGLMPGTTYEVRTVSVVDAEPKSLETKSEIIELMTAGEAPTTTTAGWLIAIIVAIIILIIILIIVCLVVRNRGAKYPVSQKEKEQGREPMLKDERGFGEYERHEPDEEKRSLTGGSKAESETDSMAEYGDGETGRFTEDGSFIGQYGAPNKVIAAPTSSAERGRTSLSTFV